MTEKIEDMDINDLMLDTPIENGENELLSPTIAQ